MQLFAKREKYAFPPPLFSSPFNHFFPQYDIWPYFQPPQPDGGMGWGKTEKYTPLKTPPPLGKTV